MTIWQYVKERKYMLFLLLFCSILHVIVLFLYVENTEPVLYVAVIYMFFVLLAGSLDYLYQNKKHQKLISYDMNSDKSLKEILPESGVIESDYQNIIHELSKQQKEKANFSLKREKELSNFYTMWVHQIKTPIAALGLLMQTNPENTFAMKGELFKIERYVDIILNYLRLEDMNQDLLFKQYSLEKLVKQAVKKYSPLFIQSKLALKFDNLSVDVLTDEKWLVFVMEQLLSNAIKYTNRGEIHVYANVVGEGEVKKTKLSIEDTGIGIRQEDLPRIFDRAFTGYNGRNDKKASGLGLYLCKTILSKLGHEITITSTYQKGTCVIITFFEDRNLI